MIDKLIANLSASFDTTSPVLTDVLAPVADELAGAQEGVVAALDQMAMTTADGEWLDEWGAYFGVPRLTGESDVEYGPRVVTEIIRPKENNFAIAKAIKEAFGQDAVVTDVTTWDGVVSAFNGGHNHDGAINYSDAAVVRYGLFDIQSSYSLESGVDVTKFAASLREFVERFRAAGTQLRTLSLGVSVLTDYVLAGVDEASITVTSLTRHNGTHTYWGMLTYGGEYSATETLS